MAQSDSGIYQIRNKVNGKVYIGSSVRVEQRISTHKRHLLLNKHSNQKLQLAYNKYGVDNFEYSVLEYLSKELLLVVEQNYIDSINIEDNYNICPVAGNTTGYKWTEETRDKISKIIPERSIKISQALKGRKHSDEHKAKVSAAGRGKLRSEETKAKMRKPKSDTHKANISKGQLGRKRGPYKKSNQIDSNLSIVKHSARDLLKAKEDLYSALEQIEKNYLDSLE